ncbi:MAG: PAS domain S-box protein [Bacteroidota bacterium]
MSQEDEGPFLKEERKLINAIAQQLGKITEQRNAKEETTRQSGLIRSLLNSIPDMIFFKDLEGVYMGCNPSFTEFVGKSRSEIIGKTDYDLFEKEVADIFRYYDLEMFKGKQPRHNEEWVTYPDDRKVLLDTLKTPYLGIDGTLIGILGISRDITAKKAIEDSIKQSEHRLQMVMDVTQEALWDYEVPSGKVTHNNNWYTLLGNQPGKIDDSFDGLVSTIHPDDKSAVFEKIDAAIHGKTKIYFSEHRLIGKQKTIWVQDRGSIVERDSLGNAVRMVGSFTDITERKVFETSLIESESQLRTITDSAYDAIVMMDNHGRITFWNPAAKNIFGHTTDEAIGRNLHTLIVPQRYRKAHNEAFPLFLLTGQGAAIGKKLELKAKHKDGHEINVELSISSIKINDTWHAVGIIHDISIRKAAEIALIQLTEMQKIMMEIASSSIHIPIEFIDNSINNILKEMGEFVSADRIFIFSYDFDRQTTSNTHEWCSKGTKARIQTLQDLSMEIIPDWINQHQLGNIVYIEDALALPEDDVKRNILGPQKIKSLLAVPMMSGSGCLGFVAFSSVKKHHRYDESEIKLLTLFSHTLVNIFNSAKSEKLLHESNASLQKAFDFEEKLFIMAETANKSKSTFLANMSHEIRTPLNAIIGFSQLMKREKSMTSKQQEFNNSILRAADHLLRLINDILELSKIEAGRVELKSTNFDLHALLHEIHMLFKEQVQSKQIQIIVETSHDLPRNVVTDEQKLRQILINLIGNAVKFTNEGGITVRSHVDKRNEHKLILVVEIQDSGVGIAENELEKLFKQFEQTSSGIKNSMGTGLGLALSRELAVLMGGNVTVASEEGKGSVFTVTVEIKQGAHEHREASSTKRVTGIDTTHEAYRVLVVDDKEENRQVLTNFLKLAGFITNEAVDGTDAIAKFEQWEPHLILMDMRMPGMDGYEATQQIKSTEKGKYTPVIAVTASIFEDEKKKAFALEIQGYIHKPFRESELFETIGNILGIKYIYEEEKSDDAQSRYLNNDEIVDKDITKLSEKLTLQMKNAVESADFHLLTRYIKSVENDYPELCRHLLTQAEHFNYNYLLQVLTVGGK